MTSELQEKDGTDQVKKEKDNKSSLSLKQLMWRRFKRNKLALISLFVIGMLFIILMFCEFFAPYGLKERDQAHRYQPPQFINFISEKGEFSFRPFVYEFEFTRDPETFRRVYKTNYDQKYYIYFFIESEPYKLLHFFTLNHKLFGVKEGSIHLFGTDKIGLDFFSLILYGGRVSLAIALVGVLLSIIVGSFIGVVSGYFGGNIDHFIQRFIELLMSFPRIPLWMALSAALPPDWGPIMVFFGISIIISLLNWGGLARQLRGKVLALREEDFLQAARALGAPTMSIIITDLIPNCLSHIIVVATVSIPGMIIAETSLSFLGLGIRKPMVSWGSLLQDAQNVNTLIYYRWYIIPALFVIVTVLLLNFLGDGIRDAADPFSS